MKQYEKIWLDKVNQLIEQNISNPNFSMNEIAQRLEISRTKLYRHLVKLTGFPPSKYLLNKRLALAKELLETGIYSTVAQIALAIGFNSKAYFSRRFFQKYQIYPKTMLQTKKLIKTSAVSK